MADGLVDVLRLAVAPTLIGQGRRLFPTPGPDLGLRLTQHDATPTGLLVLEYARTGAAPRGDYAGVDHPSDGEDR